MRRTTLPLARVAGGVAAALALSFTVTACGAAADKVAEEAAEKAIEDGSSEDVDVEFGDDGEFSVEGEDGDQFSVGSELPDDFPVDDIPLVDGEVVSATSSNEGGQAGWIVVLDVDASAEDVSAEADEQLTGAGFTADGEPLSGLASYTSDAYAVQVLSADNGDGTTSVQYYVTSAA